MAEDFPHLLSPLRVGPKTLRNRVLVTGHVDRLAENNLPTPAQAAYQAARARGGAGLQITGAQAIHSSGRLANPYAVENLGDEVIPGYRLLADAVHAEGGLLLAQLAHSASTVGGGDADRPTWAPSPIAGDEAREVPHAMTRAEIAQMIDAYGKAAARVRLGGLDGAEILAAFGYLPIAFLSPNSNKRGDAYGGSLENRLRFIFEVIEAVRAGAGPDIIVGVRIPGDERTDGGLTLPDMQEIARRLAGTGRIDYLNIIAGTNMDRIQRWEHWPPTPAPHGLFVELAAAIKAVVAVPVFVTGRITDPRDAEAVIRDGKADMVGMTRAHIADPDLVAKLKAGHLSDIRPCVGANVCITTASKGLRCFHNPEVGRETAWGPLQPAERPKRVAVIGGGPAGMEAARVAALRGHRVTLYERDAELGGQLRRWAKAPRTGEFGKSVAWFEGQLERLQVRVERGRALSAEDLAALDAEVIVLATGAQPKAATPVAGPGGLRDRRRRRLCRHRRATGRAPRRGARRGQRPGRLRRGRGAAGTGRQGHRGHHRAGGGRARAGRPAHAALQGAARAGRGVPAERAGAAAGAGQGGDAQPLQRRGERRRRRRPAGRLVRRRGRGRAGRRRRCDRPRGQAGR